jgi:hypothetical protein
MSGIELKHAMAAEGLPTLGIVITSLVGDQWLVLAEKSGASFLASRSIRRRCSVW